MLLVSKLRRWCNYDLLLTQECLVILLNCKSVENKCHNFHLANILGKWAEKEAERQTDRQTYLQHSLCLSLENFCKILNKAPDKAHWILLSQTTCIETFPFVFSRDQYRWTHPREVMKGKYVWPSDICAAAHWGSTSRQSDKLLIGNISLIFLGTLCHQLFQGYARASWCFFAKSPCLNLHKTLLPSAARNFGN